MVSPWHSLGFGALWVTGLALSCSALCRAADPADRGRVHPGWPEGAHGQAGARPQYHPSPVCCASPGCRGTPLPMAPGLAGRAGGVGERSPPLFFLFKIFFSFLFFLPDISASRDLHRARAVGRCWRGRGWYQWHPGTIQPFSFPGRGWDLRLNSLWVSPDPCRDEAAAAGAVAGSRRGCFARAPLGGWEMLNPLCLCCPGRGRPRPGEDP